jgi:hypothetical protein
MKRIFFVCLRAATFGTNLAPRAVMEPIEYLTKRGDTGVCVPTGDPLIAGQHPCCNCKTDQHLFLMVPTW